jgi:hypothetical protein
MSASTASTSAAAASLPSVTAFIASIGIAEEDRLDVEGKLRAAKYTSVVLIATAESADEFTKLGIHKTYATGIWDRAKERVSSISFLPYDQRTPWNDDDG